MSSENASKKPRTVHSGPPPVCNSIQDLAQGSTVNEQRYRKLAEAFESRYSTKPQYICRAPGRVNIIGEHVDYSGYGVLPMAIEQDVAIASRRNDTGELRFHNTDPDTYPEHSCPVEDGVSEINREEIFWYSYILCGIKGMLEEMGIKNPVGMDIMVDGSIPPASGLSSSSALVCCAALTALCVNEVDLPSKKDLAEMCARSERFIGTQGGGMDQAISFLGELGKAMMIEFNPVRPSEVQLPDGYSFIISNTLVRANKAAESSFNTRVAECRTAAHVMAKKSGKNWREIDRLLLLSESLGTPLSEMSSVCAQLLHSEAYTRQEVCDILEIADSELLGVCLNEKSKDVESFQLYDRAKHVYEEANRVYLFESTANSERGKRDDDDIAKALGQLMNESHTSCSALYQCSCAELDEVTALCREAGGLGARLTGAGWGGCAVSLVRNDGTEAFLAKLKESYYDRKASSANLENSLFATKPGPGAAVCKFEE